MAKPRLSLFSCIRYGPPRPSLAASLAISTRRPRQTPVSFISKFRAATLSIGTRPFSTSPRYSDWLSTKRTLKFKEQKGRPRVPTGGSVKGTTIVWGDYGLRMIDHHRRISAAQLRNGEDVIRRRLRGMHYRLFMRVHAGSAVYTKGNESRMGTGKGNFDYWAARVAVSRIIFEVKGEVHEQVIRDALRLAANKLPGKYEFVKKSDPPVMGITKLGNGLTAEDLKRPRKKLPGEVTAHRLPGTD